MGVFFAHEGLPINSEQRLQEVEALVREYPEVAGLQAYEYFGHDAADLADDFIKDPASSSNPSLTHDRLEYQALQELAERSEAVLTGLLGEQTPQGEALFDAVEYRQSELFMLAMATRMNDQSLNEQDRAEAADWFKMSNEALYGVPEKELFTGLVYQRIYPMLTRDFDDPQMRQVQQELRDMIGNEAFDFTQIEELQSIEELAEHLSPLIRERFDGMVAHIDDEQIYHGETINEAVEQALTTSGAREKGWTVKPVEKSSVLDTTAHSKTVNCGGKRPAMSGLELKGKIVHEFVHMLRSVNAEDADWLGPAYGMDGYLDFEETFSIVCERVYWKPPAGMNNDQYRYLAAGFTYGIDRPDWHEGERGRDFRDTYEILWRAVALETASNSPQGELPASKLEQVKKDEAYTKATVRVRRGTPCALPGIAYLKDLSYIRGHRLVAQVVPHAKTQRDLDFLLAGKTDPTKPHHRVISDAIAPGSALATAPWSLNNH